MSAIPHTLVALEREYGLESKYTREEDRIYLSGVQPNLISGVIA